MNNNKTEQQQEEVDDHHHEAIYMSEDLQEDEIDLDSLVLNDEEENPEKAIGEIDESIKNIEQVYSSQLHTNENVEATVFLHGPKQDTGDNQASMISGVLSHINVNKVEYKAEIEYEISLYGDSSMFLPIWQNVSKTSFLVKDIKIENKNDDSKTESYYMTFENHRPEINSFHIEPSNLLFSEGNKMKCTLRFTF